MPIILSWILFFEKKKPKKTNPEVEFFQNSILFNSVCNDAISYLDWNGKHYVEPWVVFTCSEYVDIISKFH